ncbi:AraC family transcriptional regulator [Actinopolymorpha sp. B11F2]|uniref:AraC family transcriptional regulator n=1 Tax=Actinopolymorpha sp. B11F2 TaxID=3160862 RepID=UPI0032E40EFC
MTVEPSVITPKGIQAGFHAYLERSGVAGLRHAGDQRAPTSWLIGPHAHAVWEFYLQTDGPPTRWRVGASEYEVARHGLLAVPPRTRHHMVRPAARSWQFVFAGLDVSVLLEDLPDVAACWQAHLPYHLADAHAVHGPFDAFLREVTTAQALRGEGLKLSVQHLLVEITRQLATTGQRHDLLHPAVAHARRILDARYADSVPLAELSGNVGLSPTYLTQLYTRQIGVSPARYQANLRIERAEMLLTETDRSITTIASELGFSSAQHFATVFRRHTGRSPSELRRRDAASQWRTSTP